MMPSLRPIRAALAAAVTIAMLAPAAALAAVPPRALSGSGSATFKSGPGSGFRAEGESSSGLILFKEHTGRRLLMAISGEPDFPLTQDHPRTIGVPIKVVDADHASGRCRAGSTGSIQVRAEQVSPRQVDQIIFTLNDCGLGEGYVHGHAGNIVEVKMSSDKPTASPWKAAFSFRISTRGAKLEKPPRAPKLDITYKMGTRILSSLDGLARFPSSENEIDPDEWKVSFEAIPCEDDQHSWSVAGKAYTTKDCSLKTTVSDIGPTSVSVSSGPSRGSERINLKDTLILGLGDSLASGEGVPDRQIDNNHPAALWGDKQCHRSADSHQALTALAVDRKDPRNSTTFVHLACSGAAFSEGLFGPYKGIEPDQGPLLGGQFFRFKEISGGRRPDVVLMSIGVNHAHFGAVLGYCTVAFQSVRDNCRDSHVTYDEEKGEFSENFFNTGPTLEEYVAAKLKELPSMYARVDRELDALKVKPGRVYIVLYPDPTRNRDGRTFCKDFLEAGPGGAASIDPEDTRWLALQYALPLNAAISVAARRYHWNLVKGYHSEFSEHGYCAGRDRWTVTYDDSFDNQGDKNGTVHPNYKGHKQIAKYEIKSVVDDLFPDRK
jgi:hypothetical protein